MANETNYIGVAMGLDVSDLKSGLSEANKQIQLANSEFKAASSGMEDWTKSTEGLNAKIKQLDSVLTLQKKKLAGLEAEYNKVAVEQGENSEAARKLKVQLNNQKAVVNNTERELNNYKETLQQAENGTIDLTQVSLKAGKAISNVGEGAEEGSKGLEGFKGVAAGIGGVVAGLGAAVAGLVAGFFGLAEGTRETRAILGKLETAFTTAGLSAEDSVKTYEQLYGVLGDEGKANEAALHIASLSNSQEDLAKWTDIATGVYATFGDSLPIEALAEAANETSKTGQITGGLADALNWAGVSEDEFQASLDKCTTQQERQALITETLNGLYDEAADKYKDVNGDVISAQEAHAKLTNTLADLGAIAEPIMTTLKLLAADLLETMLPFVELIGEGLQGAFEGTAGATDTLAEGLSGLISTLGEKLVSMLPTLFSTLVSVISTLLPQVISTIVGFLPTLITMLAQQLPILLQAIISGFSQILTSIGSMLPELIPVIIDAILTIVETLLDNIDMLIDSGIALLMGLADGLIAALPNLIDKIPVILDKLISAISRNAPKLIQSGIELIIKLAGGLIKAIPQLISKIPEIISSLVKGFTDYKSNMEGVGLNLLKGIWEGIKGGAKWLKDKITGFAGDVAGWFKDTFKINSPSKLIEDEIGVNIGKAIVPSRPSALRQVKKSINDFSGYVTDNLGGIKDGLGSSVAYGSANGSVYGSGGNTTINAGMTVNYNGKLSRKELKKIENDNYTSIKMRLKNEGLVG